MTDESFERFVRETHDGALRLAYSYLGDWEEARDAAQGAYVLAHRSLDSVREEEALKGWFNRILTNHLKDCLRRRKLRNFWSRLFGIGESQGEERPDPAPSPEKEAINSALKADLRVAVEKLPARQAEVFRLKAVAGLTFTEIAKALLISEGAAKTHHQRALAQLKTTLRDWREA